MWLDVLIFFVLAGFAWAGARRGGAVAAMGVATLVASYWAALAAGGGLGSAVAIGLDLPDWAGVALAGSAAFMTTFAVMSLFGVVVRQRSALPDGEARSARDLFLGGVFGALRGAFVALLLSYAAIWVDALRATGTAEVLPELGTSAAASVTEAVVVAGVESALEGSGPAARVVARVAGRPGAALSDLQGLLESPQIAGLQGDPLFWSHVEAGSIDNALNQRSFLQLTHDDALRAQLATLGLIDEEAAADPIAFREAAHGVLEEVSPRIRGLRNNPELQELLADPEVVAMVQTGDTIGLLRHDGFRGLVTQIAASD
jgi:hypothetical protein